MKKFPSIIGVLSPGQFGDTICSLVAARYIKKVFPDSYSVAVLDPKTRELAPLLINNSYIDKIYINEKEEGYTEKEKQWASTFDFNLPIFGHYVPPNWSKTMSWVESNFRLRFQFQAAHSSLSASGWDTLTEDEKKPKLEQWFKVERFDEKVVVVSPFVGYSLDDEMTRTRSPSLDWWESVVEMLLKVGFTVVQIGTKNFPPICDCPNFYDYRNFSLFESVRLTLGADLFIGACGGMSFIINAYGQKSICPYTDWVKGAKLEVLLPVNYKNRLIPLFGETGINSISLETVREAVLRDV